MSRELLKRAIACKSIGYPLPASVQQEIEAYLAQPEPEPVAWIVENHPASDTFVNFTPNFNSHFEKLGCKVTPLYITPPDQSARVAELEKSELFLKDALEAAIRDTLYYRDESESRLEGLMSATEANRRLIDKITSLEQQLAANLQAKLEPLNDAEIDAILDSDDAESGGSHRFARAIELAHGIKNCL